MNLTMKCNARSITGEGPSSVLCIVVIFTAQSYALRSTAKASCPSVMLRYRSHISLNSWKIISRLITLTFSLSADPNMAEVHGGVGKIVDFRHLRRRISETVQDRVQVAIDH